VVLLDEPFTALDTGLRSALRDEVAAMLAAAGVTAILVTHDQTEALSMADQVALMRAGAIVQVAPPEAIYREPADLDVARFLGDVVLLDGDAAGDLVTCLLGPLVCGGAARHGPVTVVLRPEQIHLVDGAKTKAVVHGAHFQGHDALVELTVGTQQLLARWSSTQLPARGDVVGIEVVGPVVAFERGQGDVTAWSTGGAPARQTAADGTG
jgi:iron(III) transport system ATP-binding protein